MMCDDYLLATLHMAGEGGGGIVKSYPDGAADHSPGPLCFRGSASLQIPGTVCVVQLGSLRLRH
jgi:hypothetical protein